MKSEKKKGGRKAGRVVLGVIAALILSGALFSLLPFRMNDSSGAGYNRMLLSAKVQYHSLFGTVKLPEGAIYIDGAVPVILANWLTIDGNNAAIINTGYTHEHDDEKEEAGIPERLRSGCFLILASRNVRIKDLTLVYMSYSNVVGTIVEKGNGRVTLQMDEAVFADGRHRALTGNETVMAVNEYDDTDRIFTDVYVKNAGTEVDPENARYTIDGVDVKHSEIGDQMVVRFSMDRSMSPFMLAFANGTVLENIRVLSTPNMLILGAFCDTLTMRGLHVESDCKEKFRWGSVSDGVHLANMKGLITLEDSTFIGMGDDVFNCNSLAMEGKRQEDEKLLLTDPSSKKPISRMYVKRGDVLRLYSTASEPLGEVTVASVKKGVVRVKAVKPQEEEGAATAEADILAFMEKLPDRGVYVENIRFRPEIEIRNNTVRDGRARAFLIRSGDVSVRDNHLSDLALAGILVTYDLNYWHEMGPSENVMIEDNEFLDCCTENSSSNFGVIAVKGSDDTSGAAIGYPVHKNIIIRNNSFTNCSAPAVFATGVKGLVYEENTVTGQKNPTGSKQGDEEIVRGKCVED